MQGQTQQYLQSGFSHSWQDARGPAEPSERVLPCSNAKPSKFNEQGWAHSWQDEDPS